MPGANVNREFQFLGEPTQQSLRDNDKALILALGEIYSKKNLALNIRSFTADATLDTTDAVVFLNSSGGSFTITLPPANDGSSRDVMKTRLLIFRNTDSGGQRGVTIARVGSDLIVDSTSSSTNTVWGANSTVVLHSDGVDKWYVVHRTEYDTFPLADKSGAALVFTGGAIYTRVNNIVTVSIDATFPATASPAVARITGGPYTCSQNISAALYCNAGGAAVSLCYMDGFPDLYFLVPAAGGPVFQTNAQMTGARVITGYSYRT